MNRNYTVSHYLSLVKKIRKNLSDVYFSTDIIIGFPGETKKQFEDTKNLMKKIKFDMAYLNIYSPRFQTMAYKLKDNIAKEEKERRKKSLNQTLTKTALKNNQKYIDQEIEVLVRKKSKKKKNTYYGQTKTLKDVEFESDKDLLGKFIRLKIIEATPWGLKGKLI